MDGWKVSSVKDGEESKAQGRKTLHDKNSDKGTLATRTQLVLANRLQVLVNQHPSHDIQQRGDCQACVKKKPNKTKQNKTKQTNKQTNKGDGGIGLDIRSTRQRRHAPHAAIAASPSLPPLRDTLANRQHMNQRGLGGKTG